MDWFLADTNIEACSRPFVDVLVEVVHEFEVSFEEVYDHHRYFHCRALTDLHHCLVHSNVVAVSVPMALFGMADSNLERNNYKIFNEKKCLNFTFIFFIAIMHQLLLTKYRLFYQLVITFLYYISFFFNCHFLIILVL